MEQRVISVQRRFCNSLEEEVELELERHRRFGFRAVSITYSPGTEPDGKPTMYVLLQTE